MRKWNSEDGFERLGPASDRKQEHVQYERPRRGGDTAAFAFPIRHVCAPITGNELLIAEVDLKPLCEVFPNRTAIAHRSLTWTSRRQRFQRPFNCFAVRDLRLNILNLFFRKVFDFRTRSLYVEVTSRSSCRHRVPSTRIGCESLRRSSVAERRKIF